MRLLIAALAFWATLAGAQMSRIYPPEPQLGEPVVAIVDIPQSRYYSAIRYSRVEPGRIIFSYNAADPVPANNYTLTLPAPPAGDYQLFIQQEFPGAEAERFDAVQVATVAGTAASPARRGVTGNYFSPDENGWGVNVLESDTGPQLFVVWLDYLNPRIRAPLSSPTTSESGSTWRVMSGGRWIDPNTFRGLLYETRDGTAPAGPSKQAKTFAVGYVQLTFLESGEMDFQVSLRTGPDFAEFSKRKRLRRQGV